MSRLSQEPVVTIAENNELLEVIREEQCSPALSVANVEPVPVMETENKTCNECICMNIKKENDKLEANDVEKILLEKEAGLRREFTQKLEREINDLKEKFDYILRNEQVRASYMLREAHRERQEKITALQGQLECKNLAGLMFVMCAERRKSKLEKLRLVEEYTSYIRALQHILSEGQDLILHLSRGYKTAARIDYEWRQKMTKIIHEFQAYIYHFSGGTPESNQYLFDLPALLKTEASIYDDLEEDPCEIEEEEQEPALMATDSEDNKRWYESLEGECRPFVVFGDMAEFTPPERRTVLKAVKAAKTAPKHWKDYVFNEMYLRSDCSNADVIKDEYEKRLPPVSKWECMGVQTDKQYSKTSLSSRRVTTPSIDVRGNMGSLLKIITSSVAQPSAKATLLGARDSMEIASTTKLREKRRQSSVPGKVVINVGKRSESLFDQMEQMENDEEEMPSENEEQRQNDDNFEDEEEDSMSLDIHNDSLQVTASRVREKDKINYEKVCPMEACQRMGMDSFIRSLPPYMRSSPFMHFEHTYDDYEACSPEQLQILMQRIEDKKKKEKLDNATLEDPLREWSLEVEGVAVQTSVESLPPCTCMVPSPTPVSSVGKIFNLEDLIPIKRTMNEIPKEFFYDADIEFNRFQIIGQESEGDFRRNNVNEDFTKTRLEEIKRILKQHPSLCDIFQANTQC